MKKYIVALFVLLAFSLSALFLLDNEEIKAQNQTYEVGDIYGQKISADNVNLYCRGYTLPNPAIDMFLVVSNVDTSGNALSLKLDYSYYVSQPGFRVNARSYSVVGSSEVYTFNDSFDVSLISNIRVSIEYFGGSEPTDLLSVSSNVVCFVNGQKNDFLTNVYSTVFNSLIDESGLSSSLGFEYNKVDGLYYVNSITYYIFSLPIISQISEEPGFNDVFYATESYLKENRLYNSGIDVGFELSGSFVKLGNFYDGFSGTYLEGNTFQLCYRFSYYPDDYVLTDVYLGLCFEFITSFGGETLLNYMSVPLFVFENGLDLDFYLSVLQGIFPEIYNFSVPVLTDSNNNEIPIDSSLTGHTYYLIYDLNNNDYFVASFDLNGGTLISGELNQLVYFGRPVSFPVVTREGYRFVSWNPDIEYIAENTTFVAQWEKIYQVTFDLGDLGYFTATGEKYGSTFTVIVVEGGTASWNVFPVNNFVTAAYVELSGWSESLENVQSDMTVTAVYTGVDYAVSFLPGNTSFTDGSQVKYATVNYMTGFSVSFDDLGYEIPVGHDLVFNGSYVVSLDSESDRTVQLNNFVLSDYKKFFTNLPVLNPFDFEDLTDVRLVAYVDLIDYSVSFTYINSFDLSTVTKTYTVKYGNKLASYQIPQPVNYTGNYFIYWQDENSNNFEYQNIVDLVVMQDYDFTAIYSPSVGFSVTFYYQFEKLRVLEFQSGIGTISPPNFSFPVGVQFYGWSLELNGALLDLSSYSLEKDVDLYAVTNFSSSSGDVSFDIPYNECQWYDIPCHLGNAFIYFINDFPIISDIVSFIVPVGTLVSLFVDNILLLDTLGWIFTIGIAIFFVAFIFRFMR